MVVVGFPLAKFYAAWSKTDLELHGGVMIQFFLWFFRVIESTFPFSHTGICLQHMCHVLCISFVIGRQGSEEWIMPWKERE